MTNEGLIEHLRISAKQRDEFAAVMLAECAADRIEDLSAKLAKAVVALDEAIYLLDPDEEDIAKEAGLYRIVTTHDQLKGET